MKTFLIPPLSTPGLAASAAPTRTDAACLDDRTVPADGGAAR